jgi:hypothetical protein
VEHLHTAETRAVKLGPADVNKDSNSMTDYEKYVTQNKFVVNILCENKPEF